MLVNERRLDYVMSLSSEPVGYKCPGATIMRNRIGEESHQAGRFSESSLSCEIAACA